MDNQRSGTTGLRPQWSGNRQHPGGSFDNTRPLNGGGFPFPQRSHQPPPSGLGGLRNDRPPGDRGYSPRGGGGRSDPYGTRHEPVDDRPAHRKRIQVLKPFEQEFPSLGGPSAGAGRGASAPSNGAGGMGRGGGIQPTQEPAPKPKQKALAPYNGSAAKSIVSVRNPGSSSAFTAKPDAWGVSKEIPPAPAPSQSNASTSSFPVPKDRGLPGTSSATPATPATPATDFNAFLTKNAPPPPFSRPPAIPAALAPGSDPSKNKEPPPKQHEPPSQPPSQPPASQQPQEQPQQLPPSQTQPQNDGKISANVLDQMRATKSDAAKAAAQLSRIDPKGKGRDGLPRQHSGGRGDPRLEHNRGYASGGKGRPGGYDIGGHRGIDPRLGRNGLSGGQQGQHYYSNKGQSATANYVPAPASQQARNPNVEKDELGDRLRSARSAPVRSIESAVDTQQRWQHHPHHYQQSQPLRQQESLSQRNTQTQPQPQSQDETVKIADQLTHDRTREPLQAGLQAQVSDVASRNGLAVNSPLRPSDFPEGADAMDMDFERVMRDMGWSGLDDEEDDDDGLGLTEEEIIEAQARLMAVKRKEQADANTAQAVGHSSLQPPPVVPHDEDDSSSSSSDDDDF